MKFLIRVIVDALALAAAAIYALHVLANAVGGLGGRFFEELRSKRSLAYTVSLMPVGRWLDRHGARGVAQVPEHQGADLVGRTYTPPFGYYLGHERAFRLVPAEFVTTTDGTGLVHTAGAFGEDDKVVTDREGIEAVMPVGKDGRFTFPEDARGEQRDNVGFAQKWHVPRDVTLVATAGHLHPGGEPVQGVLA